MKAQKTLIFCTFVATISFATSGPASFMNGAVFPDDERWLSSLVEHKFEHSKEESNEIKNYKVCQTTECKNIAEEFSSSLNKSIDPCEDFYEFSCSGWAKKNPIPPSLPSWSRYLMFQQTVHRRIKEILETEPEPSDILPVRQAKKWYRSCLDTETLEQRGLKPIESILLRAGGWPIAMDPEEWDAEVHTWQEVENDYARLTGAYTFFDLRVYPSIDKDIDYGRITITHQELPLGDQMPLKYRNYKGNDYKQYVNFVAGIAGMFANASQADLSEEQVLSDAIAIVEFEKKLYELRGYTNSESLTMEEFFNKYEKNVTEPDADPKTIIDWRVLIEGLFDTVNIKVHPSTKTNVWSVNISGMRDLLRETSARTIVNFVHWNFVANMLTYTIEDARNMLYVLLMEEYGIKERPPRWSECVNEMKMTNAAAYAFVNKYVTNETEANVLKMTKTIQSAMENQIETSDWLDEESKLIAKDKLNSMQIFVGFPDWYKSKKSVLKSYKGLTIGTEYFDNTLSFIRYKNKKDLKKYTGQKDDDDPWKLDPITVNAAYVPGDNLLNIPAADFQSPLFTPHLPSYVNYATVGVVAGHEIGHGFDEHGIQYGKYGSRTDFSKVMLKSFYQRAECFTDQFDVYYGETKKPGATESSMILWRRPVRRSQITRGENMADTTGLQSVFEAYKNLQKSEGSVRLPGFEEYTDDQLFFISFGAMWCEAETPQFEKKKKESRDPHSPSKIRVTGAISNTKGFAEAFNCPVGSGMNPVNKCDIWGKSDKGPNLQVARINKKHHRWEQQWRI